LAGRHRVGVTIAAVGVDHYENFPVASLLCPPRLRPAIVAVYRFARTADDIADEGSAAPEQRLAQLRDYRRDLDAALSDGPGSAQWPAVFAAMAATHRQHQWPAQLLHDLLDAFEQDVCNPSYPDREALLDYCRRSANPVGRLLLHLYGERDPQRLLQSDRICSALQLINFWQDLGVDQARGRNYLPASDIRGFGLTIGALQPATDTPALRACVRSLCDWAAGLMQAGAPLALHLPGRAGWELRLVVQGGLRILEKIARIDHATARIRPTLRRADVPVLLWRALRMGAQHTA
jgi:hydroxysqualene synthase